MRIVSGRAGGTVLKILPGAKVRPTADRVKESLFASLGDMSDWTVADLFSGTGALGLEAWSRGARTVLLVEKDSRALRCIHDNLARVRRSMDEGISDIRVISADVARVPERLADFCGRMDLILADPPYQPGPREFGAADLLCAETFAQWGRGAILVLEHATGAALPWAPLSSWRLARQRRFGGTTLSFARN